MVIVSAPALVPGSIAGVTAASSGIYAVAIRRPIMGAAFGNQSRPSGGGVENEDLAPPTGGGGVLSAALVLWVIFLCSPIITLLRFRGPRSHVLPCRSRALRPRTLRPRTLRPRAVRRRRRGRRCRRSGKREKPKLGRDSPTSHRSKKYGDTGNGNRGGARRFPAGSSPFSFVAALFGRIFCPDSAMGDVAVDLGGGCVTTTSSAPASVTAVDAGTSAAGAVHPAAVGRQVEGAGGILPEGGGAAPGSAKADVHDESKSALASKSDKDTRPPPPTGTSTDECGDTSISIQKGVGADEKLSDGRKDGRVRGEGAAIGGTQKGPPPVPPICSVPTERGILNRKNDCFLISAIQFLRHMPTIHRKLLTFKQAKETKRDQRLTLALSNTLKAMQGKKSGAMPLRKDLTTRFFSLFTSFKNGQPADMEEALESILYRIHEETVDKDTGSSIVDSARVRRRDLHKCQICGREAAKEQDCYVLHLNIPTASAPKDGWKLRDLVKHSHRTRTDTDSPCNLCKTRILDQHIKDTKAERRWVYAKYQFAEGKRQTTTSTIVSMPDELCLGIDRFNSVSEDGTTYAKNHARVKSPMMLHLANSFGDHASGKGRLTTSVSHHGQSLHQGHWTLSKSLGQGNFVVFNDGTVKRPTKAEVARQGSTTTVLLYLAEGCARDEAGSEHVS